MAISISPNLTGASVKKPISLLAAASAFSFSTTAHAAEGDAKDKKGDARKALMKQCLSKKPA